MKIQVDSVCYSYKPKNLIKLIKTRTQSEQALKESSLENIAAKIGQGYSISPGVMVGGLAAEHWTEQQIFLVDIDNDKAAPMITPNDALAICAANGLPPAFWYSSYSDTVQKPKFRLAFVMREPVTDTGKRALIVKTLIGLFTQADTSCENADRIFFGTNKKVVLLDLSARIDIEAICGAQIPPLPRPSKEVEKLEGCLLRLQDPVLQAVVEQLVQKVVQPGAAPLDLDEVGRREDGTEQAEVQNVLTIIACGHHAHCHADPRLAGPVRRQEVGGPQQIVVGKVGQT